MEKSNKVMVVDDMAVMRKMVSKILSDFGFSNLITAEDGKDALKKLKEAKESGDPVCFIVSDWNMPNMSGIDLLRTLRADPETKKLPFLMVTAEGEKENLVLAIKEGVTNFVVKPFTPPLLQEKIKKIFPKL